jgi:hypothetical protein
MHMNHDAGFMVFLRVDHCHNGQRHAVERLVKNCGSYEEARRLQREFLAASKDCVIRYQGPEAGGGD